MRKLILMALAALPLVAGLAKADDIADGEILFKTKTCIACHGPKGQRPIQTYPALAGQNEKYLLTQMQDIKSAKRIASQDPETGHPYTEGMSAIMHLVTDEDLNKIAAYLSKQEPGKPKPLDPAPIQADLDLGATKFKQLGCVSCHGVEGKKATSPAYPILAGLNRDYLARQMSDLRQGLRVNGQSKMMLSFIKKADDPAIAAIAAYLSQLDRSAK